MPIIPLPTFDATAYVTKVTNILRGRQGLAPLAGAPTPPAAEQLELSVDAPTASNTKAEISVWLHDQGIEDDLSALTKAELLDLVDKG